MKDIILCGECRTPGACSAVNKCALLSQAAARVPQASKTVTVIQELGLLRGALDFIQSLAEEELPFAPVGSGHEVALRHIERRAREALAAPRADIETTATPVAYVPLHPRTGPLWANTVPSLDAERPAHYPVMALYATGLQHETTAKGRAPCDCKRDGNGWMRPCPDRTEGSYCRLQHQPCEHCTQETLVEHFQRQEREESSPKTT